MVIKLNLAVAVAISSATKKFDREYIYLVPESLKGAICPGMLVVAPFANRKSLLNVMVLRTMSVEDTTGLKFLAAEQSERPSISTTEIELAAYMRRMYNCTWFDAFKCMLPKGWDSKNWRSVYEKSNKSVGAGAGVTGESGFTLNVEQRVSVDKLVRMLKENMFKQALLHGVTGGGKTEVYLHLIKAVVDSGREAIALVPEISLTPQMIKIFKSRFPDNVAVFHSRMTAKERREQWINVREGRVAIAIGARSAVFAPFKNLGAIIIDEEHESTYKSEAAPRYHAAEVAAERCKQNRALLLYGSATPSVERFFAAKSGEIELFTIRNRTNRLAPPAVYVADLRDELKCGNRSMFSEMLKREINKNIQNGEQTILFLNRRGHSSFVLCRSCGYILSCRNCSISYTYHSDTGRMMCHYCGATVREPDVCPVCRSRDIRHFGAGTQRIEEEVRRIFPGASVLRMDRDATTAKNSHEKILKEFRDEKVDILVGTQMIAKGLDFPNVTLVGILAADSLLNINDFRTSERAFQLLTQVSGRAGRGNIMGRVIIQTYNPDHYSVTMAQKHDYCGFYEQEILVRKNLEHPPFMSIGVVIISGADDRGAFDAIRELHVRLCKTHSCDQGALISKPLRPPIEIIKDKFRWRFIIKHRDAMKLADMLSEVDDLFYSGKLSQKVELSVDINPYSMQ